VVIEVGPVQLNAGLRHNEGDNILTPFLAPPSSQVERGARS
jgi:hypothetical protein